MCSKKRSNKMFIIERDIFAEAPPRVEYSLTPLEKSLKPILDAMSVRGTDYKNSL